MQLAPEIKDAIDAAILRALAKVASAERFLTSAEAGEVMRLHPHTVLRLVREGKLRAVGEGRLLRIPYSAVHDYFSPTSKRKGDERCNRKI